MTISKLLDAKQKNRRHILDRALLRSNPWILTAASAGVLGVSNAGKTDEGWADAEGAMKSDALTGEASTVQGETAA